MQTAKPSFGLVVMGVALLITPAPVCSSAGLLRQQNKSLSFAERVAYQYAIEEVYWRHRIWPRNGGENPGSKPSLHEVMSRAQVEKKVSYYLRSSQVLADECRPITSTDLQAEMDRMASHTKQPDVLRELFAALNNDPFVIAECLARPILAERLVSNRAVAAGVPPAPKNSFAAGTAAFTGKNTSHYMLPEISPLDCADDSWTPTTTTNTPTRRYYHTAVWTGSEMIVWGGYFYDGNDHYLNTGGRYNPSTDSWLATSTVTAPSSRWHHTAVWTGTEMVIWGGGNNNMLVNTGGRYNPTADSWASTSTAPNAPTARDAHTAVWNGSEMIVWGGFNGNYLNSGGRYNPGSNSWSVTSATNAPDARGGHTAVWTGSEMIVWGGAGPGILNSGGRYNPSTDSWIATSTENAPAAGSTAVWTGNEMIVWGGSLTFNAGGRYNPATNSWTATSTTNAPMARFHHTAVWNGSEMIVWGGFHNPPPIDFNNGGRYNPATDTWMPTSMANVPEGRESHTAVWTGGEMLVWGGVDGNNPVPYLNTGGGYCAQPSAPIVQSAASRKAHGGAGSFDVNLPLSGTPGIECRSGGATNDYTVVVTFLANVSVNGNPQAQVTLGTGTVGSGGVSNGGVVTISGKWDPLESTCRHASLSIL